MYWITAGLRWAALPVRAAGLGLILVVTLVPILQAFHGSHGPLGPAIPLFFLAPVLVASTLGGRLAGGIVAVASTLDWDWFFIPPLYRITVATPRDLLALVVFLGVALLTGQLSTTVRTAAREAQGRARTTEALYELSVALIGRSDLLETLSSITSRLRETFDLEACAVLLPQGESGWKTVGVAGRLPDRFNPQLSRDVSASARWAVSTGRPCGLGEPELQTGIRRSEVRGRSEARLMPLRVGSRSTAVLELVQRPGSRMDESREQLLMTLANGLALALEQEPMAEEERGATIALESDRLKSALLSSVSHDLRTPLAGIKAAASSLLQKDVQWTDEDREGFLVDINTEVDRLTRLISNLLDLSRIEAGVLRPSKDREDVAELVRSVVHRLRPVLSGHDTEVDAPGDLPMVLMDSVQIDQVITNLLENAARYSPPGAPIKVELSSNLDRGEVAVSVVDVGSGIPAHLQDRIFDKFYRVSSPTQPANVRGTGMGLAIAKGLAEAHGGSIAVESTPGHGSRFTLTLPIDGKSEVDAGTPATTRQPTV